MNSASKKLKSGLLFGIVAITLLFLVSPSRLLAQVPGGGGLFVPVLDTPNLQANTVTAASTAALKAKEIADELTTLALKVIINATRDTVIRWIATGRFAKPTFSQSFNLDLKKSAENAVRTVLGQITGIPFCDGTRLPASAFVNFNLQFALACRFNGNYGLFQSGRVADFVALSSSEQSSNDFWNRAVTALDYKLQTEEAGRKSFTQEYQAGQGFLGLRNTVTGLIDRPGSYVRDLVKEIKIVSPQRAADVANTAQQAVNAIVETAIQTAINRGLDAVFSEREEGEGGVQVAAPPPAKEPILQKIATTIARGNAFLANVEPTANVENVRGITPQQAARIREIMTSLTNLQNRLIAATSGDEINSIAASVDLNEIALNAAMSATRFCSVAVISSPWCPPTP